MGENVGENVVLFSYGKREDSYTKCIFDFKVNKNTCEWFKKDFETYVSFVSEDLKHNNFVFELGRFCGKNDYGSILFLLSMDVPGRLIFILPSLASFNRNHYNDLKEFLEKQLGFEIIN